MRNKVASPLAIKLSKTANGCEVLFGNFSVSATVKESGSSIIQIVSYNNGILLGTVIFIRIRSTRQDDYRLLWE